MPERLMAESDDREHLEHLLPERVSPRKVHVIVRKLWAGVDGPGLDALAQPVVPSSS